MRYISALIAILYTHSRFTLAMSGTPEGGQHHTPESSEPLDPPERLPGGTNYYGFAYDRPNPELLGEADYFLDVGSTDTISRAYYYVDHDLVQLMLLWSKNEPNRAAHITYREQAGLENHEYVNSDGVTCSDGGSCWYNPASDPGGADREERLQEVVEGLRSGRLTNDMDVASYQDLVDYMQPTIVMIPGRAERETVTEMFNQALRHAKDLLEQTGKIYTINQADNRQEREKAAFERNLRIVKGPYMEGYNAPNVEVYAEDRRRSEPEPSRPQWVNNRIPLIAKRPSSDPSFGPPSGNIPKGSLAPLYEKYNLIDTIPGSSHDLQSQALFLRSSDRSSKRSVLATITKQESYAMSAKSNKTAHAVAEMELYLNAWEATRERISTAVWPFLVSITNGTNCSLIYDLAWSIWSDLTAADVDVIGPFSHGMTSLPTNPRLNGTRISNKNHTSNYTAAVIYILSDLYQYAWDNSVQAANKTGDLQYLLDLGAALSSNSAVQDNSTSTTVQDLSWFTTYNQTNVPQELGYKLRMGNGTF